MSGLRLRLRMPVSSKNPKSSSERQEETSGRAKDGPSSEPSTAERGSILPRERSHQVPRARFHYWGKCQMGELAGNAGPMLSKRAHSPVTGFNIDSNVTA